MASGTLINKEDRGCNTCGMSARNHPDCFQKNGSVYLKICSICKVALYGNAACQKSDWPAHKPLCKRVKAVLDLPKGDFPTKFASLLIEFTSEGHTAFALQLSNSQEKRLESHGIITNAFCSAAVAAGSDVKQNLLANPNSLEQQGVMLLAEILVTSLPLNRSKVTVKDAKIKVKKTLTRVEALQASHNLPRNIILQTFAIKLSALHSNYMTAFRGLLSAGDQERLRELMSRDS